MDVDPRVPRQPVADLGTCAGGVVVHHPVQLVGPLATGLRSSSATVTQAGCWPGP